LVTNLCGTLRGFHTSDARSGRQSLPSLGHWCLNPLQRDPRNIGISLLSLSRYAVYKVECLNNTRSPLTLDCFVRSFLRRFERCTQDTLSRRRLLFACQRTEPESADPRRKA
jgi:hypothetical protein